jgi:tRNA (guanosine-2'-O-)-methyltransferase
MRRTTPGVQLALRGAGALLADSDERERIIRILEPLVTAARQERLREVIARRLSSVVAVLDAPYDPHNGAAVARSCEAFGVQYLHVVERPRVPFAIASSVARGAEKWIDVVHHAQAASLLAWARDSDTSLVAAHPEGELAPEELMGLRRLAIIFGNEREGIGEPLARACAARVRVPMRGFAQSLNVSVTAAVLLRAATLGRAGDLESADQRRLYARGLYLSVPHADDLLAGD